MLFKSKTNSIRTARARRRAVRRAGALSADRQSLAAVYALGIRDGLRIAADIREKTKNSLGEGAS